MIVCPNCAAQINKDVTKCPYCGYINLEGAQRKYMDDLDKIKDDLASVEKEPAKALKKGLSKGGKVILLTVSILLILAIIYVVILLIELQNHPKELFLSAEEKAYASAYKEVAGEQLLDAYEDKDIQLMAQIFDKAYSEDRVNLWGVEHYEAGYAASCYMKLKKCLPNLDKEKLSKKEAEEITYYCFYFYYRSYGDDGKEIFDEILDNEIMPIINNRLGFTIQDMEAFRDQVTVSGRVFRRNVYSIVKKNYKKYH